MSNCEAQFARYRSVATAVVAVVLLGATCTAQEAQQPRVLVRDVYVPAGKMANWPIEGKAYLPIERERLESLLAAATPGEQSSPAPQVLETLLYGSMDESGVVSGLGAMQIESAPAAPGWLPLEPSAVRLANATWRHKQVDVRLGYWGSSRGLAVEIPGDGWLDFDWRVAARDPSRTTQEYVVPLPSALATSLLLDLPLGQTPEVSVNPSVLVSPISEVPAADRGGGSLAERLPGVAPNKARWLLRCGPGGKLAWRLRPIDGRLEAREPSAKFREHLEYRLAESGITLVQQFDIAAGGSLPQPLKIESPPSLVIRSVKWDGVPLSTQRLDDQTGYTVVVPASDEQSTSGHRLTVDAWHPLSSSSMQLPRVQLPGLFWEAGRVRVNVDPALKLVDLRTRNAVQTVAADGSSRRQMYFEELAPRAQISLQVNRSVTDSQVRIGRVLDLSTTDTKATVYTHFEGPAQSAVSVLSAELVDGWRPQTVTAEAPYDVDDWYVSEAEDQRRLTVHVSLQNEQVVAEPPVLKLSVEADRATTASEAWLPLSDCDVLRWESATVAQSLITFRVEDGNQLEWNPPPASMTEDESMPYLGTLLPATIAAAVYDRAHLAEASRLYLKPAAPELDVVVTTSVIDEIDRWLIAHRIECTPQRGSIDQLRLHSEEASSRTLRWRLEGDDQWYTETAPGGEATGATNGPASATWLLDLPRRQTAPFVIVVEAGAVPTDSCVHTPLGVADAHAVRQQLEIRSPEARHVQVDAVGGWHLTAAGASGEVPLHSKWLMDADVEVRRLEVRRLPSAEAQPLALVTDATLESVYAPHAPARHRFRFTVENQSESELRCQLPEQASNIRWQRLTAAGEGTVGRPIETNEFALPLGLEPGGQRFELVFSMPGTSVEHGATVEVPWPRLSVPAVEGRWTVEYPSTYHAGVSGRPGRSPTLSERLFGLLAAGATPTTPRGVPAPFATTEVAINGLAATQSSIEFTHQPTSQTWRSLAFVMAMVAGYWLWQRPVGLVIATAAAAVAALLLPVPFYSWGTALWGGLLAAIALRALELATRSLTGWGAGSQVAPVTTPSPSAWLLAMVLTCGPAVASDSPPPVVESILTPVDEQGRVAGGEKFITPRLLAELLRREQQSEGEWVISSPRYTGGVTASAGATLAPSDSWEMAFDLEVQRGNTTVEVPLSQADAAWASEIYLDGIATGLEWTDDGNAARFRVQRAGQYRARLTFRPHPKTVGETTTIGLRIPPLPAAVFRLTAAKEATGLLVDGHRVPPAEATDDVHVVPLGMRDELVVTWPRVSEAAAVSAWGAEQWEWLDVTPTGATLEGVYYIVGPSFEPPPLELRAGGKPLEITANEPDSEPSTSDAAEADVTKSQLAEAAPHDQWRLVEPLDLQPADDGAYLVRFRLHIDRPQPYGRLRLPHLQLAGIVTGERHLGVTHSDDLTVTLSGGVAGAAEMFEAELATYWAGRELPREIFSIDASGPPLVVTARPVPMTLSPDEALEVCAFDDRLEVVYRGTFGSSDHPVFNQQVQVPLELKELDVRVEVRGESVAIDTGRPDPGRLMVFFAEPIDSPFELTVVGSLPLSNSKPPGADVTAQLPGVTAVSDSSLPQQVSLYAADHLTVEVVGGDDVSQLAESRSQPLNTWRCYGVSTFLASVDREKPLKLRIADNQPSFDAAVVTTMVRQDRTWIAEISLLLDVREGSLPEVVLHWPQELIGEVSHQTDGNLSLEDASSAAAGRLRLRLARAIDAGEQMRVTLQSAVRADTPTEVACPLVAVQGASTTQYYFGLTDAGRGTWSWNGARRVPVPPSIEPLLARRPNATLIEAQHPRPTVRWIAAASGEPSYQLPLANVEVQLATSGTTTVRTQLVVPALGIDECQIDLAADQKLVQVLVDGRPGVVSSGARLTLPDPALPHFVELLTITDEAVESSSGVAAAGLLIDGNKATVEHRVWTVRTSAGAVALAGAGVDQLPEVEIAALRLNQLLAASLGSGRVSSDAPASWAQAWADELAAAEASLRQALRRRPSDAPDIVNASPAADEYDELLARATVEIIRRRGEAGGAPAAEESSSSAISTAATPPAVVFVQSSDEPVQPSLIVSGSTDVAVRWLLALVAVGCAALLVTRGQWFAWPAWNYELVFPVVILVGAVWWLWLWPPVVGLLLSMAAVVLWLRWKRMGGGQNGDPSTAPPKQAR